MPMYPRTWLRKRRSVQRDIAHLIGKFRSEASLGLHLGCGPDIIAGLVNCDLYDPAADRRVGLTDLSEFADGSVDYIEAHAVIEHVSFAEAEAAASEWARTLRPGGRLVVSCPNFHRLVLRWILRPRERWTDTIFMVYGSQEHPGMFHKSGYDRRRLAALLTNKGFEVEFWYSPYPPRPTPCLVMIAKRKIGPG